MNQADRGRAVLFRLALALLLSLLCACSAPPGPRAGALGMNDFLLAFNAYHTARTYLGQGRHSEAVVEYEESLTRYTRLGLAGRDRLSTEFGLSRQQIEHELAVARELARQDGEE